MRRPYKAVRIHLAISEFDGKKPGPREFDFFIVGESDDDLPVQRQPQCFDNVLGKQGHDGAGIDERVDRGSTNTVRIQMPGVCQDTISLVFKGKP